MSIVKAHRFPASVHWVGGRLTRVSSPDKPDLQVATPPEFRGGIAGVWSPEDLLVAAVASCFAVTFVAIAEGRRVPIRSLDVRGVGHVELGPTGRFGFVAIELAVEVETELGYAADAELVAEKAEQGCLIAAALDVPVHAKLAVHEPASARAAAV
jgi:organic hydroperoxide reductase OsmC/OhrA